MLWGHILVCIVASFCPALGPLSGLHCGHFRAYIWRLVKACLGAFLGSALGPLSGPAFGSLCCLYSGLSIRALWRR